MKDIGFIGLGIMGTAMASNLKKAGFAVTVYNRTKERETPLKELGCRSAASPKDIAAQCDTTIIMVTDPAAVTAVTEGENGWLSGPVKGKLLINMSTVSVDCTKQLADRCRRAGVRFVDCPVSGSKAQAEGAQLIMLAGGEKEDIADAEPALLAMGKSIVRAGKHGDGTALKLCVNLLLAHMTTGIAEAVILAERLNIDPTHIFTTANESVALNCGYFKIKAKNLLNHSYSPAFSLANVLKDVRFMMNEADKAGQPLPVTAALREVMEKSLKDGNGDKDLTIIAETVKAMRKA